MVENVMRKAQVFLREDQIVALRQVAKDTGRKQSEVIREGVDLAIRAANDAKSQDWKAAWICAAGIWADRNDLDEIFADRRRRSRERMDRLFPE
jgi:hypothetical protein